MSIDGGDIGTILLEVCKGEPNIGALAGEDEDARQGQSQEHWGSRDKRMTVEETTVKSSQKT